MIGGSVADRDGRVQKGDRVLSINGKGLKGVTHREALSILKVCNTLKVFFFFFPSFSLETYGMMMDRREGSKQSVGADVSSRRKEKKKRGMVVTDDLCTRESDHNRASRKPVDDSIDSFKNS